MDINFYKKKQQTRNFLVDKITIKLIWDDRHRLFTYY